MKFLIKAALGGGFGGIENCDGEEYECGNQKEADEIAYEMACEEYDSYAGLHGLRSVSDIMEEDEVNEDEAYIIYDDERESWLDYSAEKIDK